MSLGEAPSPEMAYREKTLGLGHTIFLSYSGADQNFLWELYDDLLEHGYDPFFDQKSLPKGASVSMKNILQEAANCKLGVFFLSEAYFTRNPNPMSELSICVNAEVRLLPLFYEISVDEIKNSWKSWYSGKWRDWGKAHEFKLAIQTLLGISGVENKEGLRPKGFREKVIKHIYGLMEMDNLPNVSDICGEDRLVKDVKDMFARHLPQQSNESFTQPRVVVLGLYGASGTGKSTLCRMLEHSGSEADCRVCSISLDSKSSELDRLKKVLRAVTYLSKDLHDQLTTPHQAREKLLTHEHDKKVFLIIDNVLHQNSTEEAQFYLCDLCDRFQPGSKILVTALMEGVLSVLFKRVRLKCHIAAMPDLNEEEATGILVKRAGYLFQPSRDLQIKDEQKSLVERCLNLCRFRKGGGRGEHYHPGALIALVESLKEYSQCCEPEEMTSWISSVGPRFGSLLSGKKFLRGLKTTSYDLVVEDLPKQVFLDVALYLPQGIAGKDELYKWLHLVQGNGRIESVKEVVWFLINKGLVDGSAVPKESGHERLSFPLMHDLYYEMATLIVEDKKSECLFIKGDGSDRGLPEKKVKLKRIGFQDCNFSGYLAMSSFPSTVQVLAVKNCHESVVDLRGAIGLRSLELVPQSYLDKIKGLDDCASLAYIHVGRRDSVTSAKAMSSVVTLPAVTQSERDFLEPKQPDLSALMNPRVLALPNLRVFRYSCECGDSDVFEFGHNIESISIKHVSVSRGLNQNRTSLEEPVLLKSCQHVSASRGLNQNRTLLEEPVLLECPSLKEVDSLGQLLWVLNKWRLGISETPRIGPEGISEIFTQCSMNGS